MAVNVATLVARLEADIRDFDKRMGMAEQRLRDVDGASGKASIGLGNLKSAAMKLGIVLGAAQIGRFAFQATQMAVSAEEAASAFNTSFGPAVGKVSDFVEDFANRAGFAEFELQQMLATTGSVAQGIGFTEDASADLAISMAKLAGDVASFSNASGGAEAVLAALQSAINGEREALKTYGLALSEAEVQQKALTMTGKDHVAQLTREDKALATVALAYEKAGKMVGDLDRTQESLANRQREVNAKFKEAQVAIGQALIPIMEELLPIVEKLIGLLHLVAQGIEIMGAAIRGRISELKEMKAAADLSADALDVHGVVANTTGEMLDILGEAARRVEAGETELKPKVVAVTGTLMDQAEAAEMNAERMLAQQNQLAGLTAAYEAGKVAGEQFVAEQIDDFARWEQELGASVGNFESAFSGIPEQMELSIAEIDQLLTDWVNLHERKLAAIQAAQALGLTNLAEQFSGWGLNMVGVMETTMSDLDTAMRMEAILSGEWNATQATIKQINSGFSSAGSGWGAAVTSAFSKALDLASAAAREANEAKRIINNALQIRSPSKVAEHWGEMVTAGWARGLEGFGDLMRVVSGGGFQMPALTSAPGPTIGASVPTSPGNGFGFPTKAEAVQIVINAEVVDELAFDRFAERIERELANRAARNG